ncbi:MAG: hypothetical protein DME25_19465, partial [Verrucomicrobia bacterium]
MEPERGGVVLDQAQHAASSRRLRNFPRAAAGLRHSRAPCARRVGPLAAVPPQGRRGGRSDHLRRIGDFGSDYFSTRQVSRLVKAWQPQFIITLGDNNYPSGAAETIDRNVGQFYHEFIFPYQGRYGAGAQSNRFFPCLGNHDWIATNARPYLDYFTLPGNERYYTLTRGPVQLFCVDSDKHEPDGCTFDSPQGQWFQRQLAESK